MSRRSALTLAAITDLALAFVLAVVGHLTDQVALGLVGIVMLVSGVAMLFFARHS